MKKSPEQYAIFKQYLDENKDQYGLVSYELISDITLVLNFKKGYEFYARELAEHRLKPETITGVRAETIEDENN
ncbi:hypothetical protein WCD96_11905 [Proteus mirabilis]|uniref:hypothetical protein n=1 Tax=Proteus mirabilis TaxID=584 RepID=UPI0034D525BC